MVKSTLLAQFKELSVFFFDRYDDNNIEKYQIPKTRLISCQQIHDNKIALINTKKKLFLSGYDGLVTTKSLYLNIRTADCMPMFFYDPKLKLIGAVHAGWKGLLSGIIENMLTIIKRNNGNLANVFVSIGPHIRACCYRVPEQRWDLFKNKIDCHIGIVNQGNLFLDMETIAVYFLIKHGLLPKHIEVLPFCSCCNQRFYSNRRDGKKTGRMFNIIGLY